MSNAVPDNSISLKEDRATFASEGVTFDETQKLDALRAALIKGEASGDPKSLDLQGFLAEMHREHILTK
jgi:Arc/MetJ-type ribon-helix-helix transcriptional regulator